MSNFTLIIPTHNRHDYLNRSISYYKDIDANVIYCDSSKSPYKGNIPENFIYLHLPDQRFAAKIITALYKADTNHVALCADDDFILKESLYKANSFLDKNKDFKTIVGKYVYFHEKFDGNFYYQNRALPNDVISSPEENSKQFFSNYHQILWAMYTKELILKAFTIIDNANFNNDNYIEVTIGATSCFCGGIKFLDEIWGIREFSIQDHWGSRHLPLNEVKDIQTTKDFETLKNGLDKIAFTGYTDITLESYLKFCNSTLQKSLKEKLTISNIVKKIKKILHIDKNNAPQLEKKLKQNAQLLSISSILKS